MIGHVVPEAAVGGPIGLVEVRQSRKIGRKNWEKLGKIGKNWEKLEKIGKN